MKAAEDLILSLLFLAKIRIQEDEKLRPNNFKSMAKRKPPRTNPRESPHRRKQGNSPDPYLRSFLRQAVAIITAERGLNDVSQPKLQALASQLGLTESAFHQALEKLKQDSSTLGLNRYEKKFVELLSIEFSRLSGDVLTIKAENRATDLAERKYQIPAIRAHQLIQETAAKFDVATISHHDAELFATSLIDEAIGNQLWLREENGDRLKHACRKWGMTESEIEHAIRARFSRNRKQRSINLASWLFAILGILVFAAAAITGLQTVDWKKNARENSQTSFENSKPVATVSHAGFPDWIDPDQIGKFGSVAATDKRYKFLADPHVWQKENREDTYSHLLQMALEGNETKTVVYELIANLYYQDPDARLTDKFVEIAIDGLAPFTVNASATNQELTPQQLRKAFAANRLLVTICLTSHSDNLVSKKRSTVLRNSISDLVQLPDENMPEELAYANASKSLLEKFWGTATRRFADEPRSVLALLPELEKKSSSANGPEINKRRTNLMLQIVEQSNSKWMMAKPSIQLSISKSDSSDAADWLDILLPVKDRSLAKFLASPLAARFHIDTRQQHETLMKQLRQIHRSNRVRAHSAAFEANSAVEEFVEQFRFSSEKSGLRRVDEKIEIPALQTPEILLGCMAANNLALAWIQASRTGEFSRFYSIRDSAISSSSIPQIDAPAIRSQPTPYENRAMMENLKKISDSSPAQSSTRISAIRAIVRLAPKFENITYADAFVLGNFISSAQEPREVLEIERALPNFSKWSNLKLAISDLLLDEAGAPDESSHIAHLERMGLRFDRPLKNVQQIHKQVLAQVASDLNHRYRHLITANRWEQAEPLIAKLITQRARILGFRGNVDLQNQVHAMETGIHRFVSQFRDTFDPLNRALEFVSNQTSMESEKLALLNLVLSQKFDNSYSSLPNPPRQHRRTPDFKPSPKQICSLEQDTSLTSGQRLAVSELILMETLSVYRNRWAARKVGE